MEQSNNVAAAGNDISGVEVDKPILYKLPVKYVYEYGDNATAILQAFAWRIRERQSKNLAGELLQYYRDGKSYISYPIGVKEAGKIVEGEWTYLVNDCPWLSSKTFERIRKMLNQKKLIESIPNPITAYRYVGAAKKLVRNSYWHTMPPKIVEEVLLTDKMVHFDPVEAHNHTLSFAILWNKVCYLFDDEKLRNPQTGTLTLAPKELSESTGLQPSTIRDLLASFVELRRLARVPKTPQYQLLVTNTLAGKHKELVVSNYVKPEGLSSELEQQALEDMQDALITFTKMQLPDYEYTKTDEKYFRETAELCFSKVYNPYMFVMSNIGTRKSRSAFVPCFLRSVDAETKYIECGTSGSGLIGLAGSLEDSLTQSKQALEYLLDIDKHAANKMTRDGKSFEEIMLSDSKSQWHRISAWVKVVLCPPEHEVYSKVIEKYGRDARLAFYNQSHRRIVEALFSIDGIYPQNLFPYYTHRFQSQVSPSEQRAEILEKARHEQKGNMQTSKTDSAPETRRPLYKTRMDKVIAAQEELKAAQLKKREEHELGNFSDVKGERCMTEEEAFTILCS